MADERIQVYESKMTKTLDGLTKELATIRAGRANPHILDKLTVDYYGTPTPLQQVANITVPEARMIQIQPWEASLIKEISKAIMASDLGFSLFHNSHYRPDKEFFHQKIENNQVYNRPDKVPT